MRVALQCEHEFESGFERFEPARARIAPSVDTGAYTPR